MPSRTDNWHFSTGGCHLLYAGSTAEAEAEKTRTARALVQLAKWILRKRVGMLR